MQNYVMNIKHMVLFVGLLSYSFIAQAQKGGIRFQDTSWTSLLSKAKSSDKLIFLDAYASWCGPCKLMKKNIFTLEKVGEVYNRNFINVAIDMEKGEGKKLQARYAIQAYPTFLYINGNGEVVHKTVGKCSEAEFIQNGLDALSPLRNLKYLTTHYDKNRDDFEYINTYLNALKNAFEDSMTNVIALRYLNAQPKSSLSFAGNWHLINDYVRDPTSPVFRYVVAHQKAFDELYSHSLVEKKIYDTYLAWPRKYITYPDKGSPRLDKEGFTHFLKQVQQSSYNKKAEIIAKGKLSIYFGLREWGNYAKTVNQMLKDHIIPMSPEGAEWLYSYANKVNMFSKDKAVLSAATEWTKIITGNISHIAPSDKVVYLDLYATLLEKKGEKTKALAVRKQINKKKLTEAKMNAPFQSLQAPKSNN